VCVRVGTLMKFLLENIVTKLLLLTILLKMARTSPSVDMRSSKAGSRLARLKSRHFANQAS